VPCNQPVYDLVAVCQMGFPSKEKQIFSGATYKGCLKREFFALKGEFTF
jgi:hypothetical protein